MMSVDPAPRSRRTFLLVTAAGCAATALGGIAWVAASDPRVLVLDLLRQALPGVRVDEASGKQFAADFLVEFQGLYKAYAGGAQATMLKWRATTALEGVVGLDRLEKIGSLKAQFADHTRFIVTRYLMNSNFFEAPDPRRETIYYVRRARGAPCISPFADLRPPM